MNKGNILTGIRGLFLNNPNLKKTIRSSNQTSDKENINEKIDQRSSEFVETNSEIDPKSSESIRKWNWSEFRRGFRRGMRYWYTCYVIYRILEPRFVSAGDTPADQGKPGPEAPENPGDTKPAPATPNPENSGNAEPAPATPSPENGVPPEHPVDPGPGIIRFTPLGALYKKMTGQSRAFYVGIGVACVAGVTITVLLRRYNYKNKPPMPPMPPMEDSDDA